MIVFLLVLTLSTPGVMYTPSPPMERVLVASPEVAAVEIWRRNHGRGWFEGHWSGELYRIDLDAKSVTKAPIPKITFEAEP